MNQNNFVLTNLSNNPEYFEEVVKLIEHEFHYNNECHYENDFAPLMDPQNFENCFFLIDNKTNIVAAHLAICPRKLIKGNSELRIALVGGIATHKNYRGKHLFTCLMNHAIELYKDQVGLFILWSDLENLYEKFLFFRTGGIIETGQRNFIAGERPVGFEKTSFPKISDQDFHSIIELYSQFNQRHFFTIKREDKDWSIIREMNSVDLYVKRNSIGEIEKYFCINKGRDLTNIVHEISCKNSSEFALMIKELKSFKMWMPESERSHFANHEIFYMAFAKLGAQTLLNEFLYKVTDGTLQITSMQESQLMFEFNKEAFASNPKDFLQYLFGPRPLKEFESFELSLYIAGVDSI